jgi:hypothetical protein
MSFKNFREYLAERAKYSHGLSDDDKGFANRDYKGDLSIGTTPQGHRLQPEEYYSGPNTQKNPGLMTADGKDRGKPFGDMASAGFTATNAVPKGVGKKPVDKTKKIGGKKKGKMPTKKTMKVEQFLDKTKGMSDVQFARNMLEGVKKIPTPTVRDLYGREYTPEPAQTMKYVAQLMLTNENMMRRMVRELKRNDGFAALVAEVLTHPETYECLNEAARGEYGKMIEQKIGMFFEGISPPRAGGAQKGPASDGAPGGGGGTPASPFSPGTQSPTPGAGMMGGMDNGGGDTVSGGGGAGGMQGMGEDEMGGMGGGGAGLDDAGGGDIEPEDDDHHDDDEDDDDEDGLDDNDDGDEDDEDLADEDDDDDEDDDEDEEDDDHQGAGDMSMGMGGPAASGMGMGGMGGPGGGMGGGMGGMGM